MSLMSIEGLSKSFADKKLLDDVDLGIQRDDKIGFIGRNGEGKTTFLKIIAGLEYKDSGKIMIGSDVDIEYLPQNLKFDKDITVLEQVFRGDSKNIQLVREYERAIHADILDDKKILRLTEQMDRDNAWELESEAKSILNRLGIDDYTRKMGVLSGGQKRRVALASALINPAELLILDEPTNHLDNDSIEWLEGHLLDRKGALLMVTHDRYFLDRVVNKIVELDNKKLYEYEGNYNYFIEKKVERQEIAKATERRRQSIYKQELAWMKQGVRARGTRSVARVERFEKLRDSKQYIEEEKMDISLAGQRLGGKIIEIKNVSKSFDKKEIIDDFSYTILRDDRIGILGDNGAGKSTLMNIITGRLEPDSGRVEVGETIKIGYFSQESEDMEEHLRAIDYIKEGGEFIRVDGGGRITASQMMERFLFTGKEQYTRIEKLSGGERRRLYLLRILMEGPNLLILDEPTNDLDIDTLNVLEDYIEEFIGPVIIVSHDRYLLDKVVNKVFHIEDTQVKEYPGNYSYYRDKIKEIEEEKELIKREEKEIEREDNIEKDYSNRNLRFSYNEQREWDNILSEIDELEKEIDRLELDMEEAATDYERLEEIMSEKTEIEEKLEYKMMRWMELSEKKEKIDNQ